MIRGYRPRDRAAAGWTALSALIGLKGKEAGVVLVVPRRGDKEGNLPFAQKRNKRRYVGVSVEGSSCSPQTIPSVFPCPSTPEP